MRITVDEQRLVVGEVLFLIQAELYLAGKREGELLVDLLKGWSCAIVSACLLVILEVHIHLFLLKIEAHRLLASVDKAVSKKGEFSFTT